jgi:hypothetical protein
VLHHRSGNSIFTGLSHYSFASLLTPLFEWAEAYLGLHSGFELLILDPFALALLISDWLLSLRGLNSCFLLRCCLHDEGERYISHPRSFSSAVSRSFFE